MAVNTVLSSEIHLAEGGGQAAGAPDQLLRQRAHLRQRQFVIQRDHGAEHHADQHAHTYLDHRGTGHAQLALMLGGPVVQRRAQRWHVFGNVGLQQRRHLVPRGVEDLHQPRQQCVRAAGLVAEERGHADPGQHQRADDDRRQHDHRDRPCPSRRQPAFHGGRQNVGQLEHQQAGQQGHHQAQFQRQPHAQQHHQPGRDPGNRGLGRGNKSILHGSASGRGGPW
jgi:hypothetical protein